MPRKSQHPPATHGERWLDYTSIMISCEIDILI